jgi:YidC/Oxa1 family membrane protein insertase
MIQSDPGIIVGPISSFLGMILDAIFGFVYGMSAVNALGISIILLTIFARFLMLPLAFGQQKSMMAMQRLAPEVEKIKKKYADQKTPEAKQKMNAEVQRLYTENKVNPFMGCLPLLIQMPIFIALNYIMQQSYAFINVLGDLYYRGSNSLVQTIFNMPGLMDEGGFMTVFRPLLHSKIPDNMAADFAERGVDIFQNPEITAKIINRFSPAEWVETVTAMPDVATQETMNALLAQKNQIEQFFGIDLIGAPITFAGGFSNIMANMWPGILIPLVALLTTALSSYIMTKQSTASGPTAQMQQRMMLIMMPLMMGFFTATFPAGVGLYWITSTVFQIAQQMIMFKFFKNRLGVVKAG